MRGMDAGQRVRDLEQQLHRSAGPQASLPAKRLGQTLPFDERHDHKGPPVLLPDVVDRTDVVVAHGGGGAGLAHEPLPGLVGTVKARCLDGHVPAELRIAAAQDHPHTAGAQTADDLIATHPRRQRVVEGLVRGRVALAG